MLRDTVKISYHGVFLSIGKVYMHQTVRWLKEIITNMFMEKITYIKEINT